MRTKKRSIASLIALFVIVGVSLGGFYTNAKYTSKVENGRVSASVAQYVFDVTANDSYNISDNFASLKLAQTCNAATLTDGKIAPGTSGSFDIVVKTKDSTKSSDVGVDYVVTFTKVNNNALPKNLVLKLDGADWNFADGISGTINANHATKTVTHTVTWEWKYNTPNGDEDDTADGLNAFDFAYTINAVGTQVQPH